MSVRCGGYGWFVRPGGGGDKIRYSIPVQEKPTVNVSVFKTRSSASSQLVEPKKEVVLKPQTYGFKRGSKDYRVTAWRGDAAFVSKSKDITGIFRVKIEVQKPILDSTDHWVLRIGRIMQGVRILPEYDIAPDWDVSYAEAASLPVALGTYSNRRRRSPCRTARVLFEGIGAAQKQDLIDLFDRVGELTPIAVMPDPYDPLSLMHARIPSGGLRIVNRLRYEDDDESLSDARLTLQEVVQAEPEDTGGVAE